MRRAVARGGRELAIPEALLTANWEDAGKQRFRTQLPASGCAVLPSLRQSPEGDTGWFLQSRGLLGAPVGAGLVGEEK